MKNVEDKNWQLRFLRNKVKNVANLFNHCNVAFRQANKFRAREQWITRAQEEDVRSSNSLQHEYESPRIVMDGMTTRCVQQWCNKTGGESMADLKTNSEQLRYIIFGVHVL
ncbi:hypothetical protein PIB30_051697 [Stylosanthes scabra]|uniref:Uncharacterized protein n=1 Tax=Stylosanthes scabra TaxID=79078 RepID=A0ABU6XI66_9FABA|nr:hypothetical protein [Stylosanthes scabra]